MNEHENTFRQDQASEEARKHAQVVWAEGAWISPHLEMKAQQAVMRLVHIGSNIFYKDDGLYS